MTWPGVPLAELAAPGKGSITDGPFGSNLARQHYRETGPRVVRLQNIGDGVFVDNSAHIAAEHFETLRNHEVIAGDLLVASLGDVLPRACLAPKWLGPAIVKADCIRVRLSEDVDPHWVNLSMQRPAVRKWAEQHRHGVGRPRLGLKGIRALPIPLPSLPEQRRIVEILEDHLSRLDAADRYLATNRARLAGLRRSALDLHFGFRPPGVTLGELVTEISAGRSFGTANRPAGENEWGIIRVSAMTWGAFRAEENKAVPSHQVDPRFEIQAGDLLVSRANTHEYVGASVLVPDVRRHLLLSDKSLRVVPRPGVGREWLWRALQAPSARHQISALATGTKDSMRNISQDSLRAVRLPLVAESEQRAAVAGFSEVDQRCERLFRVLGDQEARSQRLRQAVLAAAFEGKLTGRDTDSQVIQELAGV